MLPVITTVRSPDVPKLLVHRHQTNGHGHQTCGFHSANVGDSQVRNTESAISRVVCSCGMLGFASSGSTSGVGLTSGKTHVQAAGVDLRSLGLTWGWRQVPCKTRLNTSKNQPGRGAAYKLYKPESPLTPYGLRPQPRNFQSLKAVHPELLT